MFSEARLGRLNVPAKIPTSARELQPRRRARPSRRCSANGRWRRRRAPRPGRPRRWRRPAGAVEDRVGEAFDLPAEEVAVGAERTVVAAVGVGEALDLGGAHVPRLEGPEPRRSSRSGRRSRSTTRASREPRPLPGDQVACVGDVGVEATHRADLQDEPRGDHRGGERLAFPDADPHRPLDEHMLSGSIAFSAIGTSNSSAIATITASTHRSVTSLTLVRRDAESAREVG